MPQGGRRGGERTALIRFTLCPLDLNCTHPKYAAPKGQVTTAAHATDESGCPEEAVSERQVCGSRALSSTAADREDSAGEPDFGGSNVEQLGREQQRTEMAGESCDARDEPAESSEEVARREDDDAHSRGAASIIQIDGGGEDDVDVDGEGAEKEAASHSSSLLQTDHECEARLAAEKRGEEEREEMSTSAEATEIQPPTYANEISKGADSDEQGGEPDGERERGELEPKESGQEGRPLSRSGGSSDPSMQGPTLKSLFMDLGRLAKADLTASADTRSVSLRPI